MRAYRLARYRSQRPLPALSLLFLIALLESGTAWAQTATVLVPPDPQPPSWEEYRERVPVGGGFRVGLMALTDGRGLDPQRFTVFLPALDAQHDTMLCVEVSSKDGRYVGTLPYALTPSGASSSGPHRVALPTKHADRLRGYRPEELAILAHLSPSCDGPTGHYVVAAWDERARPDTLSVLINSDVYASVVGGEGLAIDFEVPCRRLASPAKAYNRRCDIPAALITPATRLDIRQRASIWEEGGDEDYDYYPLPLRLR